jgi:hypothetical protein
MIVLILEIPRNLQFSLERNGLVLFDDNFFEMSDIFK